MRTKPTPLGAGLRSLLVPGWGQLATRQRGLGWMLVALSLVLVTVVGLAISLLGPVELAARLADPDALALILLANALLALGRLVAAEHAWRARGGRSLLVALVLALLVLAPHVALGYVGFETRSTLLEVFAAPAPTEDPGPVQPPTTTTTMPPETTTTLATTTTTPPAVSTTTTTTVPIRSNRTDPLPGGRLNLLLLGGDAGPGRTGLRTDTIMVASLDPVTGDAALFGLPRNYTGFTFSDGTPFPGRLLNEVYGWGSRHPEVFGGIDPGASAVRDVAQYLTGLEIDYFMMVDLTGFAEVVDALGGVALDVPKPIDGPLYDPVTGSYEMIHISAGAQTLDGGRALAYARSRLGSSDYSRMGRQRCIVTAIVDQAEPVSLLTALPELLDTVKTHLTTDVPLDLLPDLIRVLARVDADQIRVVGFDPTWTNGSAPDVEAIRAAVQQTISEHASAAALGIPTAGEACG